MLNAGGIPEAFITAHDALVTQGDLRPGERVLIHGVGSGVGTAAVQVARLLGATTVGTSRTEAKLRRAEELGLDQGVLASETMADEIGEVDVVIDLIGGDYIATDVEVCRLRGRIVIVGLLAGARAILDLGAVRSKRLTIRGTTLRVRPDYERALAARAFEREVLPSLQSRRRARLSSTMSFCSTTLGRRTDTCCRTKASEKRSSIAGAGSAEPENRW